MSAIDRILASFEALTALFTKRLPAAFVWSYSVESATETSFSGRRLSPDCPFDDMPEIPLMPGIAGAGIRPAVGSIALVAFVDGDPGKPHVVGWDQQVPLSVTIDAKEKLRAGPSAAAVEIAGGGPAVARVNDTGTAGSLVGAANVLTYTTPDGGVTAFAFALSGGAVVITQAGVPGDGVLKTKNLTGSPKVTCG